jgi:hypothetical protein
MLLLLLAVWSGARAVWWENPFAPLGDQLAPALDLPLASQAPGGQPTIAANPAGPFPQMPIQRAEQRLEALGLPFAGLSRRPGRRALAGIDPRLAAAHRLVWYAALRGPLARTAGAGEFGPALVGGQGTWAAGAPHVPVPAPALAPRLATAGRWTLDAWAFWRQGSDAAPVSQGRVPVYGASQAGAVLQFRLAPGSARDPRLYARAYRALVRRGESELALGASARPFGRVPVRVAGEVRYTDGAFSDAFRPAAYAVTELPPIALPFGAQLEAYGQAGWVGGPGATPFADGQASVTREVRAVAGQTDNVMRLSLGAAAWGGAQEDAQRIDIGPTLRLDLTVGAVPARLSVDWRERVGGDAAPESGLAATFSTRF